MDFNLPFSDKWTMEKFHRKTRKTPETNTHLMNITSHTSGWQLEGRSKLVYWCGSKQQCVWRPRGTSGLTKRKHMLHNYTILLVQLSEEGTPTTKGIKSSKAVQGSSVLWCQGVKQRPAVPHGWDHDLQTQLPPDPLGLPPRCQGQPGQAGELAQSSQRPWGSRRCPNLPFLHLSKLPVPWRVMGV